MVLKRVKLAAQSTTKQEMDAAASPATVTFERRNDLKDLIAELVSQ